MKDGLFIAAFTSPFAEENEARRIATILSNGEADIVHIRKPSWNIRKTEELIRAIPEQWHRKLKLHDHFALLDKYDLAGVHLNSRNPFATLAAKSISISLHSIEQLEESEHYDYVTLSPVFDSISKEGYRSAFDLDRLRPIVTGKKVVALGGVTPDKFGILKEAGFFGAAMLGYFWNKN